MLRTSWNRLAYFGLQSLFQRFANRKRNALPLRRRNQFTLGPVAADLCETRQLLSAAITAVSPNSGTTSGGTTVTISGSGFTNVMGVEFGSTMASYQVLSSSSISAVAPAHSAGTLDIQIMSMMGNSSITSADQFSYTASPPSVTGMSPNSGAAAGGNSITISGSGFTGASAVKFGSTSAGSFSVMSDSTINVMVPAHSAGQVDVTVISSAGTSSVNSGDHYTFNSSGPTVSSVSPGTGSGSGGTSVTITGTGFNSVSGVTFGGTNASSFTVNSSTSITAVAPSHTAGTVDIVVSASGGSSSTGSGDQFVYTTPPSPPTVTGLSTNAGTTTGTTAGGTQVVIVGTNFTNVSGVMFGGMGAAAFTVNSSTSITAITPAESPGVVDVRVMSSAGTSSTSSADQFTFQYPAPVVTSLGATTGTSVGGTSVTITGSNFVNATGVYFGTVAASFAVNGPNSIVAVAPVHDAGTVDVTVRNSGGTSATSAGDRYKFVAPGDIPTVSGLSESTGTIDGGDVITITGTNLTGVTAVLFGSVAAQSFSRNPDGTVSAVTPAESAGTVDVTVQTPNGTTAVTTADQFTFAAAPAAPTVTGLSASIGSTAGGAIVTITGTNFTQVTGVSFGSVAVDPGSAGFTVNSNGTITAVAPSESAGTVDVTVTTRGGTSAAVASDQFTFSSAFPVVTALSSASGFSSGGDTVTVYGDNLASATVVDFGNLPAQSFVVNDDGSLTVVTPAWQTVPTSPVDVTVHTSLGTSAVSDADQFTVTPAGAHPTVGSLSRTSGPSGGGGVVTITGTNFTDVTSVSFGSVAATWIEVQSADTLLAWAPAANSVVPSGGLPVDVTVSTTAGTSATSSADRYTYTVAVPVINSLSAASGFSTGGETLTIYGSSFSGATGVFFGDQAAASFTVVSDGRLSVVTPAWATLPASPVDITIQNSVGTSATTAADQFTVTPAGALPTVGGLSSSSGSIYGGQTITISGTNFTDVSGVSFGTVAATSFTVTSPTSLTVTTPAVAVGTVDVTVTTPAGTSAISSADQFTFQLPAPIVTGLSQASGYASGGESIVISGLNFNGATAVFFGTTAAASFSLNTDGSITAIAPAWTTLPATPVDVTVVAPSGTSDISPVDKYTITPNGALPGITSLSAASGSSDGGDTITITGTNFTDVSGVSFGSVAATCFTVSSPTSLIVSTPAVPVGTVDITVTTPAGTSAASSADQYTFQAPAPLVTSLSQASGFASGGESIVISGLHFDGATAVFFGNTAAASFTLNVDGSITAIAPAWTTLPAAPVDVTVQSSSGTSAQSSADKFTVTPNGALPGITSLSAASGSTGGGDTITITGTNFTDVSGVSFGSVAATWFTITSPTSLMVTTPSASVGAVDVTVITPAGTSATSNADRYTFQAPAPIVTSLSQDSGFAAGGESVVISGLNFGGASAVFFSTAAAASFALNADGSITAVAPAWSTLPAAPVDITVVTPSGTSDVSPADEFTVIANGTLPGITSLSATSGCTDGGDMITITGVNFTDVSGVSFGSVAATSFTVTSSTSLTVTTPAAAAGTVDITITTPAGASATSSADRFTFQLPIPMVTSLSQTSGFASGGESVVISGLYFNGATAVLFGNTAARSFTTNADGSITAVASAWTTLPTGPVDITVQTPSGTSLVSSADQFTVVADGTLPTIASLSASNGSVDGGDVITITGANFVDVSGVSFGTVAATSFTVMSQTTLIVTTPAVAMGPVDVTVTTPAGGSATSAADQFTFLLPPPIVTGLSQASGFSSGGESIVISGSNFTGATGVFFGNTAAASFVLNTDGSITAVAPSVGQVSNLSGPVDVTVQTPSGTSNISPADEYTFTPAGALPTIASLSAMSGSNAGGDTITITGTNFTDVSSVSFGNVAAASFTVTSPISLTVTTSASAIGTVDVTVTTTAPGAGHSSTSATSSADHFTFQLPIPVVAALDITTGSTAGGDVVTITGSNFTNATAVSFGGIAATSFVIVSNTMLIAITPPEPAGLVDVTVTDSFGTSAVVSADQFTFAVVDNNQQNIDSTQAAADSADQNASNALDDYVNAYNSAIDDMTAAVNADNAAFDAGVSVLASAYGAAETNLNDAQDAAVAAADQAANDSVNAAQAAYNSAINESNATFTSTQAAIDQTYTAASNQAQIANGTAVAAADQICQSAEDAAAAAADQADQAATSAYNAANQAAENQLAIATDTANAADQAAVAAAQTAHDATVAGLQSTMNSSVASAAATRDAVFASHAGVSFDPSAANGDPAVVAATNAADAAYNLAATAAEDNLEGAFEGLQVSYDSTTAGDAATYNASANRINSSHDQSVAAANTANDQAVAAAALVYAGEIAAHQATYDGSAQGASNVLNRALSDAQAQYNSTVSQAQTKHDTDVQAANNAFQSWYNTRTAKYNADGQARTDKYAQDLQVVSDAYTSGMKTAQAALNDVVNKANSVRDGEIKAALKKLKDETDAAREVADDIHDAAVDPLIAAQKTYTETVGRIMAASMVTTSSDPMNMTQPPPIDQAAIDAAFATLEAARKVYDVANGKAELGYVEAVGIANLEYAQSARDAAVELATTVAPAALKYATTRDALTKTMVDAASGLKKTYDDDMANMDAAYSKDVAKKSHTLADTIAGYDKTLATAISDASKLQSDTGNDAQQTYDHALADAAAKQAKADFASSQKQDQAGFQANIKLQTALANADAAQSAALDQAALTQEEADSVALQDFEDGANAAVKQAEIQLITADQTWTTTVVQAMAAALVQDSGFNPGVSEMVAAWETFVLSAEGSWVTSMTGQAAADEAQGDAQDLADKIASDSIASAMVAADSAATAAGLKWLADEIKLAKDEFKAFQLAELGFATSAINADKAQAYAQSDAAHKANKDSAIAAQKADYATIKAEYDRAIAVDQIDETDYDAHLDAAVAATIADDSAEKDLVTGVAGEVLKAEDGDASARAGEIAKLASADAEVALAAAKEAQTKNNQKAADNQAELEGRPITAFGVMALSVPIKGPSAFWEWVLTMPGLDDATNFFSGIGDSLTFGGTKLIRQHVTIDLVNYESGAYMGGQIVGDVLNAVIVGGAGGGCGRAASLAQKLARAYEKIDFAVGSGRMIMKWASGDFSFTDLLTVVPSGGKIFGRMAGLMCFVIDTPVAVGWNYEPIYVGQPSSSITAQPDSTTDQAVPVDPAAAEDGTINVGWMLAGVGIVATTVYLRGKRDDEEERQKQRSRRLIFANGKFVNEPEEDEAEGEPDLPPLARGGQGGALGARADLPNYSQPTSSAIAADGQEGPLALENDTQSPAQLPSRLAGEGPGVRGRSDDHHAPLATETVRRDNPTPEFSAMPSTTTNSRSEAADTSARPAIEFVIPRERTSRNAATTRQEIRNPRVRNNWAQIRNLFWCVPLLLAGLCFWKGLPSAQHSAQTTVTAAIKAPTVKALPPAEQVAHATKRTLVTRPIQDIRPGHRVIAKNPELAGQDVPQIDIDPETTRLVSLHMTKPDGHDIEINTLMSLDEILDIADDSLESEPEPMSPLGKLPLPLVGNDEDVVLNEILLGSIVDMELAEMGVEGPAEITAIHPCPSIEPDDGTGRRLVTSVFRHLAANVVDLETRGSDEIIGVTVNHPFWSEDRQAFVPAGELQLYENLSRADGTLTQVTRITPRRGPPVPVYNFEVDGEHVYSVGANGMLVHNECKGKRLYITYTGIVKRTGKIYVGRASGFGTAQQVLARRMSSHHIKFVKGSVGIDQQGWGKFANRGREQLVLNSLRKKGKAANGIAGISMRNKNRNKYINAARDKWGVP